MGFKITTQGDTYTARNAAGEVVAVATFSCPRRPEDCARVMRDRSLWLERFLPAPGP